MFHRHSVRVMVIGAATFVAAQANAQAAPRERWVATWAPSLSASPPRPPADSIDRTPTLVNRTLREIVRVSVGGSRFRKAPR